MRSNTFEVIAAIGGRTNTDPGVPTPAPRARPGARRSLFVIIVYDHSFFGTMSRNSAAQLSQAQ